MDKVNQNYCYRTLQFYGLDYAITSKPVMLPPGKTVVITYDCVYPGGNSPDYTLKERLRDEYNRKGNLVHRLTRPENGPSQEYRIDYDSNNGVITEVKGVRTYQMDSLGRIKQSASSNRQFIYEYNSKGELINGFERTLNMLDVHYSYSYGEQNGGLSLYVYTRKPYVKIESYTVDSNGDLLRVANKRSILHYNSNGLVWLHKRLAIDGMGEEYVADNLSYEYKYDANGNWIEKTVETYSDWDSTPEKLVQIREFM